jgi:UDP-N-acetylglucosamine acyltransferase
VIGCRREIPLPVPPALRKVLGMPEIHPTAVVEDGATLASDVVVGPFCYVQRGARLAEGCRLDAHVIVYGSVSLGARCRVHAGVVLGDSPQDLAFDAANVSHVEIGETCVLREGVTVHRGTKPDTTTRIGKSCYLMANSHVAHNCELGNNVILANGVLLAGYVTIGSGVFLSGNCVVHQFVRVGRLAMMAGLSAISQDLPPFFTTRFTTTNTISGINSVGLRRAGIDGEGRKAIKSVFRRLYRENLNVSDALREIRSGEMDPLVCELVDFISASERGICGT